MSPEKKLFPVDIFAVAEYGVEKWQDEFFWPVSDADFINLAKDVDQCLINAINTQPDDIGDLLTILCISRSEYWHFLHALKVIAKIKEKRMDILYSDKSLWYRDIMAGGRIPLRMPETGLTEYNFFNKAKIEITKFLRKVLYNYNFRNRNGQTGKDEIAEIYRPSRKIDRMIKRYIKKFPYSGYNVKSEHDWLPENMTSDIPDNLAEKVRKATEAITDGLRVVADSNGIRLLDDHLTYLENLTGAMVANAARMLYLTRNKVGKKRGIHLLAPGFGDFFSRALYTAIRQQGGKVTGFSHGGHIGLYDTPDMAFVEFPFSDEFITYTQKSIELFERIKNNHHPLKDNKVDIKSCDSNEFSEIWKRHGRKPLPRKIKRVIFVGYPHNQFRKPHAAGGFSLMHLDLELRVIHTLQKAGYETYYKVHPDRIWEIKGIFDGRTKILRGYFENYLDKSDAFLFGSIRTTAFPIALCTNKPVVGFIMDSEIYKPFPEAMGLLRKRCSIVNTRFDDRNRIIFDGERLLDILSKKPEQPNNEFIETYMFPEGVKKR